MGMGCEWELLTAEPGNGNGNGNEPMGMGRNGNKKCHSRSPLVLTLGIFTTEGEKIIIIVVTRE